MNDAMNEQSRLPARRDGTEIEPTKKPKQVNPEIDKPIVLGEFPGYLLKEIDPVEQEVHLIHAACGAVVGKFYGANFTDETIRDAIVTHTCTHQLSAGK